MPADDESDFQGYVARFTRALDAGEIRVPAPRPERQSWFSVAGTDDPQVLVPEAFAQHGPLDQMAPEAILAAQASGFAADPAVIEAMSDNALLGLAGAGRRLAARAAAIQQRAIAAYASRHTPAPGSKTSRQGFTEFSADELAWQLVINHNQAEAAMVAAKNAEDRLPGCSAALWDGTVSEYQMRIITGATGCLTGEAAAEADKILAAAVPGLTPGQTRALARRVVLMIDPAAAQERKKDAAQRARVEKFQEEAGTAALCGRDLPPDAVLAGYQHIDSQARAMKAAGHAEGLERLRAAVYLALLTGRDAKDMLAALQSAAGDPPATAPASTGPGRRPRSQPHEPGRGGNDQPGEPGNQQDQPSQNGTSADGTGEDDADGTGEGGTRKPEGPDGPQGPSHGYGTGSSGAAPFAAVITLQVPAGTLFGNGTAPGEIPGYGPLDPQTTRELVQTASAHPATRWCITTIGDDGTAREHGCVPGQHRWTPATSGRTGGGNRDGPGTAPDQQPGPGGEGESAAHGFLARLQVKLAPVATGTQGCDHTHCTDRYQVPDKLKHLIKARKATCVAPCCNWPAADGDADHTVPWPQGPTCQENLGAPCRYHHRCKQATGWTLRQTTPGQFEWRGTSGRTQTTTPATYLT